MASSAPVPRSAVGPDAPTLLERLGFFGLVAFVFVIPFERSVAVGAIGGLAQVIGPASVMLGLIGLYRNGRLRLRSPSLFLLVMAVFVAWNAASITWSMSSHISIVRTVTFAQLWLMVLLVWLLVRTETRRRVLFQAYVAGGWFGAGSILLAYFAGIGHERNARLSGFDVNANWAALAIALAIPMAWHLALTSQRRWLTWINGLYPVAALVAIGFTASRGGLITALLGTLLVPLTFGRLGVWRSALITAFLATTMIVAWNVLPRVNVDRLAAGPTEITQGDLTGRTEIWKAGLKVFPDHPILGVGAGAYRVAVEDLMGESIDSHDGYMAILVQLGLVGIVLFAGLLLLAGIPPLRATTGHERAFYLVLFGTLLVALIPANFEFHKATWFILAILTTRSAPVVVPDRSFEPS